MTRFQVRWLAQQFGPRLLPLLLAVALARPAAAADSRAVLQVFGGAGAGCGTLVRVDGQRGWLLTAAHVVEGSPRCRAQWATGEARDGQVVASDDQLDVALVVLDAPLDAITLPLAGADQWPRQGDVVELIGYGGGRLRHWSAKVNGYALTGQTQRHQTLSIDTQTIGGDSGGAIAFNDRLVGVIWGGPLAGPRGPMVATHGTCCVAIDALGSPRGARVVREHANRRVSPMRQRQLPARSANDSHAVATARLLRRTAGGIAQARSCASTVSRSNRRRSTSSGCYRN